MVNILNKLIDIEDKHLTNLLVLSFLLVALFRMLFAGAEINLPWGIGSWHIQNIDVNSLLPMALSLINLGHYRTTNNQPSNQSGVNS